MAGDGVTQPVAPVVAAEIADHARLVYAVLGSIVTWITQRTPGER